MDFSRAVLAPRIGIFSQVLETKFDKVSNYRSRMRLDFMILCKTLDREIKKPLDESKVKFKENYLQVRLEEYAKYSEHFCMQFGKCFQFMYIVN